MLVDIGVENIVDEGMGILRMRRAFRDAEIVRIELAAFLRNDEVDVLVPDHRLRHVAIIFEHDVAIALQQQVLPAVLVEFLHIGRSEEHTSELQSLMRIPYSVFCWKNKNKKRSSSIS